MPVPVGTSALADPFHVIAHRGASAYAPENTMAAFHKAVEMDAPEVETDVGFTKDHQLLLLHDDTLDRTTDGTGRPEDYSLAELKKLDAGSWWTPEVEPSFAWDRDYAGEQLITLDELLAEFGDALTYHIELKRPAPGLVSAVLDRARHHGLVDRVYIACLDNAEPLREARELLPAIKTSLGLWRHLEGNAEAALRTAAKAGVTMVVLSMPNLDAGLVRLAQELGLEARGAGIRKTADMLAVIEAGCNGMTINWPDWLVEYVGGLE